MPDRIKRIEIVENFIQNFKEDEILNECLQYKGSGNTSIVSCSFIGSLTGNTYIKIGIDTDIEIKH